MLLELLPGQPQPQGLRILQHPNLPECGRRISDPVDTNGLASEPVTAPTLVDPKAGPHHWRWGGPLPLAQPRAQGGPDPLSVRHQVLRAMRQSPRLC